MPLSKLPNEVIFLIAAHVVCYRDLRALVLSCRELYHLLEGCLSKHSYQACHGDALCCAADYGDEGLAVECLKRMTVAAESFQGRRRENPYKHPQRTINWSAEDMVLVQRALLVAVQAGSKRVVNLLLDHGAQTIFYCPSGYINNIPPLYLAVQNGHEDLVDLLSEKGACCYDLDTCPLLWATEHKHLRMIRTLLRPHTTYCAFIAAISKGGLEMVRLFIANGADPNRRGDCYNSRWERNHVNLFPKTDSRSLLEPGFMEEAEWCNGYCEDVEEVFYSTTYVAIHYDQTEILRFLLEYGVHPEPEDQLARKKGNQEAVGLLPRFSYEDVPQKKSYLDK